MIMIIHTVNSFFIQHLQYLSSALFVEQTIFASIVVTRAAFEHDQMGAAVRAAGRWVELEPASEEARPTSIAANRTDKRMCQIGSST